MNTLTRVSLTIVALLIVPAVAAAQTPESRPASVADKVTFELLPVTPESRPTDSRRPPPIAVIRITNKNPVAVTLWPFAALEIKNAKGEIQKPSSNRGRFGRRRQACFLEAVNFVTVQPGKSIDWPVVLDLYTHDPASLVGWKLAPGDYTLFVHYGYDRAGFVARCKLGCESHEDGSRGWNTALELIRDATLKVTVK